MAWVLCCFSDDHVPSILNSTYWYWVLAWVICCFSDDHVPSYQTIPYSAFWYWVLALVLCCFSDDHVPSILNSTYWYWVFAWVVCCFSDDHVPSYQTIPYHPIQHFGIGSWLSAYDVLVMTMYHHIKPIAIIHTKFDILVLGLG